MDSFGDDDPHDDGSLVGPGVRLLPFILTVSFGILFAGIADLAWLTAIGTTAPWFPATISAQMYSSTLTSASLGALLLATVAASRLAALRSTERAARGREESPRAQPANPVKVDSAGPQRHEQPTPPEELDQIISELERFTEPPVVELRRKGRGGGLQVAVARPLRRIRMDERPGPAPTGEEDEYRAARAHVWKTVAGPLAMFVVFVGIGGAMLPGSDGFAATHFQLNTGLVLFLGYGWAFLVAWAIAAIVLLHRPSTVRSS